MQQTGPSTGHRSTNERETNAKEVIGTSALSLSSQSPTYTLPGVLHFLQQEWRRFERERNEWEIEKAEYKVSILIILKIRYMCLRRPNMATKTCIDSILWNIQQATRENNLADITDLKRIIRLA